MDSQNREPSLVPRAGSSRGVLPTAADEAATRRSASSAAKRLQQELMTLMTSCDRGISAFPDGENLFSWIATIEGPPGTVFEKAVYKLRLTFPANYPYQSPRVRFETPCFHPNVDDEGHICVDILQDEWSALLDVRTVLLSIQSLLGEPNVDSPLNEFAAQLWKNKEEYQRERKLFEEERDYENGSHAAKAGDH